MIFLVISVIMAFVFSMGFFAGAGQASDLAAECVKHQEWCEAERPSMYNNLFDGEQK